MATKLRNLHLSTTTTILDFPTDLQLLIVRDLSFDELLNLSLVSKSFKSFTSSLVNKLRFSSVPSQHAFSKLLTRFSSVTRISIRSKIIVCVLKLVADSGLKIECLEIFGGFEFPKMDEIGCLYGKFEAVKSVKLLLFNHAVEHDVVEFIHLLFPSLQELVCDYSATLSDLLVEKLVHKSLNLRKISLGLNSSSDLTNQALEVLTKCVNLEHISLRSWGQITLQGFCAFLRVKKNLKSIELPYDRSWIMNDVERRDDLLQLAETISLCENLSHLKINDNIVKDYFLCIIAISRSPLTSLEFRWDGDCGYTMTGVSAMLRGFQGLTRLKMSTPWPVLDNEDAQMSQLVKSLPHLKEIYLSSQFAAYKTLFSLIQNCPLLELIKIKIPCAYGYNDANLPKEIKKNFSVYYIILYPEPVDALKAVLKLACPSLKIFKFHQFIWN